jgi:hypothetical protein
VKAIAMWQPWASLFLSPAKVHETRDWPWPHRGWVAIHATKKIVHELGPRLHDIVDSEFGGHWGVDLPRGAIIGVAKIVDCVPAESVFAGHVPGADGFYPDDFYCGDFSPGRFAFRRSEYRLLREPVPFKGRQSKWFDIPDDLVAHLIASPAILRDSTNDASPRAQAGLVP